MPLSKELGAFSSLLLFVLLHLTTSAHSEFTIGQSCGKDGRGKCILENECPHGNKNSLEVCNQTETSKFVCCPNPTAKAEEMCRYYSQFVYSGPVVQLPFDDEPERNDECGIPSTPLIVGGDNASLKEFPHMVMIGYGNKFRGRVRQWGCGGILLSEQWVLGAAHCVRPAKALSEARWANLGDLDWSTRQDGSPNEIVEIIERIKYPGYNESIKYHDIALFKLARNVTLSPYIRPVCLTNITVMPSNPAKYIAAGWGKTNNDWSTGSKILQKVELNRVAEVVCNQSYSGYKNELPRGIDEKIQLCAGQYGHDTCKGDSGGPLMVVLKEPHCMYLLVGLTSFGPQQCGTLPSVYTRLAPYLSWIQGIVWPS